ncbi:hypothetical protein AB0F72_28630 [Actinoplanes sp. NPDC023936]|uniref:hypothetical protein n=1 Tax=Actinoplanes sp. NPDC023936 TaxID=3154910 RepID=UPI0034105D6F
MEWRPGSAVFSLRDVDADAGTGYAEAIRQAISEVAASTGYEVWVSRAQDMLQIAVEVQIWDGAPDTGPAGGDWNGPLTFKLRCASGELILSDTDARSLTGIATPHGPGNYTVEVYYAGREEAADECRAVTRVFMSLPPEDQLTYLDEHGRGIERYLLRLFNGKKAR